MRTQPPAPAEYHALARKALDVYATNKDPLTASAIEQVFQIRSAKLTEPQATAAALLQRQVDAYVTLFTIPEVWTT